MLFCALQTSRVHHDSMMLSQNVTKWTAFESQTISAEHLVDIASRLNDNSA